MQKFSFHLSNLPLANLSLANLFLAVGFLSSALIWADQARAETKILVELYTSQGCSSCPPADRFAGELIKDSKDVLVLSLPVDYWDRLGWKDTLASPKFSSRQRHYAHKQRWGVYTPQMVVDGERHGVASRASSMRRLINDHKRSRGTKAQMQLQRNGNEVELRIDAANNIKNTATIWRVNYIQRRAVDIGAGENSGRRVIYHNVVKDMVPLGRWSGAALTRKLQLRKGYDGVAVFIQEVNYGPVLAAAGLTLNR